MEVLAQRSKPNLDITLLKNRAEGVILSQSNSYGQTTHLTFFSFQLQPAGTGLTTGFPHPLFFYALVNLMLSNSHLTDEESAALRHPRGPFVQMA